MYSLMAVTYTRTLWDRLNRDYAAPFTKGNVMVEEAQKLAQGHRAGKWLQVQGGFFTTLLIHHLHACTIHPFEVYNSMAFSIITKWATLTMINFGIFLLPQKEML